MVGIICPSWLKKINVSAKIWDSSGSDSSKPSLLIYLSIFKSKIMCIIEELKYVNTYLLLWISCLLSKGLRKDHSHMVVTPPSLKSFAYQKNLSNHRVVIQKWSLVICKGFFRMTTLWFDKFFCECALKNSSNHRVVIRKWSLVICKGFFRMTTLIWRVFHFC